MKNRIQVARPIWAKSAPSGWQTMPIRAVLKERKEKNAKLEETNILSVMKDVGVIRYEDKGNIGNKSSDRPEAYKIVRPNDLVLNSMNLSIGSVGISRETGVTSSVYIIYRAIEGVAHPNFFNYLFQTRTFQRHLASYGRGIMELREAVKERDIRNQPVVLPSLETQKKIAEFLDEKIRVIDELIAKKEIMIELLVEKRTALITHAVTKGIDAKVAVKFSGIDFLGSIPNDWNIVKVRRITQSHRQGYYTEEAYVDDGVKLLRITDFDKHAIVTTADCPMVRAESVSKDFFLKEGDFVFARTGGAGTFGYVSFTEDKLAFASYLIRFRFDRWVNTNYLRLFFMSKIFRDNVQGRIHGGVNQNLHAEDIKEQFVAIPSEEEQVKIASFLKLKTSLIDKVEELITNQIKIFREYRSSLIYSAVTGKMKV